MSSPVPENIDSNPSPFVPTHPFANAAGADAILRSSDGVDFYVHRTILSLVSPVFETIFSLPQPELSTALPVIDMQESSATLDRALRFFYPGTHPNAETLDELRGIIDVLMKYDMQSVISVAKYYLEKYHALHPLAVYAIAFRYGWKDVAIAAAKETLKDLLRMLNTAAPSDLEGLTAIAYHDLLHYHYRCSEAARSTARSLKWLLWPTAFEFCRCNRTPVIFSDNAPHQVPVWFSQYLTSLGELLALMPGAKMHQTGVFYQALEQAKCQHCRQFDFINFASVQLQEQVKAEIDKIELKF
ncbi:hypothetical protein DFH08DRAFT_1055169 [Mycena albidolilacea]|uniref:BTB domain-containing protein n=1 Tax=Mycena albidolilacea TaxID=1033008 RepID=A0AAD7E9D8_9AGAR|nr:hypothetical protein DFH08DRAFT_1055169 [Mycena albidolilacea]